MQKNIDNEIARAAINKPVRSCHLSVEEKNKCKKILPFPIQGAGQLNLGG
jgi:hypothetical protein